MAVITARKVKVNINQDLCFKKSKGDLYVKYSGDGSEGFSHYLPANFGSAGGRCVLEFEPELDSNRVETLQEANASIGRFEVQVFHGEAEHGVGYREQGRKHPLSQGMGIERSKQKIRLRFSGDGDEQRVVYGAYTCVVPVGDPIASFTFMYDNLHRAIGLFGIPKLVAAGLVPPPPQWQGSPILIDDADDTVVSSDHASGLYDVASESGDEDTGVLMQPQQQREQPEQQPERREQQLEPEQPLLQWQREPEQGMAEQQCGDEQLDMQLEQGMAEQQRDDDQQPEQGMAEQQGGVGQRKAEPVRHTVMPDRKRSHDSIQEGPKPKRTIIDLANSLFCDLFGEQAVRPTSLRLMATVIMSTIGLPDEPEDVCTRLHLAHKALYGT